MLECWKTSTWSHSVTSLIYHPTLISVVRLFLSIFSDSALAFTVYVSTTLELRYLNISLLFSQLSFRILLWLLVVHCQWRSYWFSWCLSNSIDYLTNCLIKKCISSRSTWLITILVIYDVMILVYGLLALFYNEIVLLFFSIFFISLFVD